MHAKLSADKRSRSKLKQQQKSNQRETDGLEQGQMSPRALKTANCIRQVQERSPHVTVAFNRSRYQPVGSVSPETLRVLGARWRKHAQGNAVHALKEASVGARGSSQGNAARSPQQTSPLSMLAAHTVLAGASAAASAAVHTSATHLSPALPSAGSGGASKPGSRAGGRRSTVESAGDDGKSQHYIPQASHLLGQAKQVPQFLKAVLAENERLARQKESGPNVYTGSISELLASQKLDEVFKSFKHHELEFETYLRPVKQEVVRELAGVEPSTGLNGEDGGTWAFLAKSVCRDSAVCTEMVRAHQRERFVSKMSKLREQQIQLSREAEKQRQLEEEKIAAQRRVEEERSRLFQQQLKKRALSRQGSNFSGGSSTRQAVTSPKPQDSFKLGKGAFLASDAPPSGRAKPSFGLANVHLGKLDSAEDATRQSPLLGRKTEVPGVGLRGQDAIHEDSSTHTHRTLIYSNWGAPAPNEVRVSGLDDLSPVRESLAHQSPESDHKLVSNTKPGPNLFKSPRSDADIDLSDQPIHLRENNLIKQDIIQAQQQRNTTSQGDSGARRSAHNQDSSKQARSDGNCIASYPVNEKIKNVNHLRGQNQRGGNDYADGTFTEGDSGPSAKRAEALSLFGNRGLRKENDSYRQYLKPSSQSRHKRHASEEPLERENWQEFSAGKQATAAYGMPKFHGISDQNLDFISKRSSADLDVVQAGAANATARPRRKRIPGLSQEYTVKTLRHPPEEFSFKPVINRYNPETDSSKRLHAQRLLHVTQPADKRAHLKNLIDQRTGQKTALCRTANYSQDLVGIREASKGATPNEDLPINYQDNTAAIQVPGVSNSSSFNRPAMASKRIVLDQGQMSRISQGGIQQDYFNCKSTERRDNLIDQNQSPNLHKNPLESSQTTINEYEKEQDQMIDVEEDSPQHNNNINLAVKRAGSEIPGTAGSSTYKAGESTMILESSKMSGTKLLGSTITENNLSTMERYNSYVPKIDLVKIKRARLLLKQQQTLREAAQKRAYETKPAIGGSPYMKKPRSRQVHTSERERFRLPSIDLEALEKEATRRAQAKIDTIFESSIGESHLDPPVAMNTPMRSNAMASTSIGRSQYQSAEGISRKQKKAMNRFQSQEVPEAESLLDTRLRQRGISLFDFYQPMLGDEKLHAYQMDANDQAKRRKKIIPEHIAHHKYTKMGQLNTQYLEMVRTGPASKRQAASTVLDTHTAASFFDQGTSTTPVRPLINTQSDMAVEKGQTNVTSDHQRDAPVWTPLQNPKQGSWKPL